MNRWYQKGLIDVDYMTGNSIYADSKMIASGTSGAWFGMYTMPSDLSAKDQNIKVIAVSPPKLNEHDTLHIQKKYSISDKVPVLQVTEQKVKPIDLIKIRILFLPI